MIAQLNRLKALLSRPGTLVALAWALLVVVLVMRAWNKDLLALLVDTDDATRLVVVRDLMGGQNWFDHVEHRLDTPFGAQIHWSRLIDLPLCWLISFFGILMPGQGERLTLFVWPLIWLLPALALTVQLTRRLVGPDNALVALVLAGLSLPIFSEFEPGRIDHHNVQAVLVLWLANATLAGRKSNKAAIWAGIAAATSLAIGAETLPIIVAAIVAFGIGWVIDAAFAPRFWRFGVSFAVAVLAHFLIATGPQDWFAVRCDALSIVYVTAGFAVAVVFAGLARLPLPGKAWGHRLIAGLAGAALVGAVLPELFPACAAGPFAGLDPWIKSAWLERVIEAQPFWISLVTLPAYTIAASLPILIGLATTLLRLDARRNAAWEDWLAYATLLLAAVLSLFLQIRGVRLAALLAVPGCVALIATLRQTYLAARDRKKLPATLALVAGWVLSSGIVVFVGASAVLSPGQSGLESSSIRSCVSNEAFAPLARLSPARLAAPVDLGPYLLLMTPHAVIGSPYHRNSDGIGDSFKVFGGSEITARAILKRRGIDFIVSCDDFLDSTGGRLDAPDALAKRFKSGDVPDWLTAVPVPDGALRIYRVAR